MRGSGPSDVLMRRAAAGLASVCLGELRRVRGRVSGARVVLLVGQGDNGGDALLAGVRLRARGVGVDAVLLGPRWYAPGAETLLAVGGRLLPVAGEGAADAVGPAIRLVEARAAVTRADLVVDGIVGLRGHPGLGDAALTLLAARRPGAPVVAVDLPSGVDPATGETPSAHVEADVTVTFGTLRACLLLPPAAHAAGRVEVVDVGLGALLEGAAPVVRRLTVAGAARLWPVPRLTDHKYSRGVLGVVAGSAAYPGAAVMACVGAVRAGAGVVKYVGPPEAAAHIIAARPEVGAARRSGAGVDDRPRGGGRP